MAETAGISLRSVQRIWHAHRLQPRPSPQLSLGSDVLPDRAHRHHLATSPRSAVNHHSPYYTTGGAVRQKRRQN